MEFRRQDAKSVYLKLPDTVATLPVDAYRALMFNLDRKVDYQIRMGDEGAVFQVCFDGEPYLRWVSHSLEEPGESTIG
jgi:hypothetical protein